MLVGAGEPIAQVGRRLVRRFAVEGHHRGGHARYPDDTSAPTLFGHPYHLNEVTTAGNDSFKTMPHNILKFGIDEYEKQPNSTRPETGNKRKDARRRTTLRRTQRFTCDLVENIFRCRSLHRRLTFHQQLLHIFMASDGALTEIGRPTTLKPSMYKSASLLLAALALTCSVATAHAETATLFRVFLNDGTAVVSYGEYARVGDRVIFSIPIGGVAGDSSVEPKLHMVNIPAGAVDWTATAKYARATRYAQYVATRAESDYAAFTGDVAAVLNAIVLNKDPKTRLSMAIEARRRLASWPRDHYGYRAGDVAEVLSMLDETISSMRAAAGETTFVVDLIADGGSPLPVPDAVMPNPTPQESITQAMAIANVTDIAADRIAVLNAVVATIDNSAEILPKAWAKSVRKRAESAAADEGLVDRRYGAISASTLKRAAQAAARADVRSVEAVIASVRRRDARLGRRRPDEINSLLAQVQISLDAAQQLRLARDRWKERVGSYRAYLKAVAPVVETLAHAQRDLDNIKRLAGSDAFDLVALADLLGTGSRRLNVVAVPDELKPAHALLVSALNLADNAVRTRRSAVMSGELRSARDASSAAAGSMTLFARAQEDMEAAVKLPQIR